MQCSGNILQIIPHQNDVGGFNGNITAAADGAADIGLGKGGGIVDAVTHHHDSAAFLLEFLNDTCFFFRKNFCDDLVNADQRSNVVCRCVIVTGEQYGLNSLCLEFFNSCNAGFLYGI